MDKDLYAVLGVSESASLSDIKKAYRALAKKHHPDANQGRKSSEEKFKEISEAYEILSDPEKRARYDALRRGGYSFDGMSGGSFDPGAGSEGLDDLLSSLFGGSLFGFGRDRRQESRSSPQVEVLVPFATAALGGTIEVDAAVPSTCAACGGRGGTGEEQCRACKGTGRRTTGRGAFSTMHACTACKGSGRTYKSPCRTCGGSGSVSRAERLAVTVPPGAEEGMLLRVPGADGHGVMVRLRIAPDSFLSRDGADVHCRITISAVKAVLGTNVMLRTLDGRIQLRIPPGTQPGTVFRVKGRGIRGPHGRGDQLVAVDVTIPADPGAEEKALWEQLRTLESRRHGRS